MALGEEPGSLVFLDGTVLGPQTVDLDLSVPERPIWRYRIVRGAKAKSDRGLIPVREAYESLISALSGAPMSATEWEESTFPL